MTNGNDSAYGVGFSRSYSTAACVRITPPISFDLFATLLCRGQNVLELFALMIRTFEADVKGQELHYSHLMNSLTLLGTGTCQIEYERRASSVLLELAHAYVLFDCGHGVIQRLLEAGVQHNQVNHIVLSHFHPDHVSDLIPFLQAGAWSKRNPRTSDIHSPISVITPS